MNNQSLRVLIVEDSEDDLLLLIRNLQKGGYNPAYERVQTAAAMKKALKNGQWDIILCDYTLPKFNAPSAIAVLKETNIDIPLIVVTGAVGEQTAAECMRLGAQDYIMKENLSRLCPAIARELEDAKVRYKEKQAEEDLKESENKYRLSFEHVTDVVFTIDNDLNISSVSPSVERLLGYKPQDFIGQSVSNLGNILTTESLDQAIADISFVLKGETISTAIYQFIAKDGTIKYGEVSGSPLIRDGRIIGIISVARDITGRRQAEEALRKSEELYHLLAEHMTDIVWIMDMNLNVLWLSPSAMKARGFSLEEIKTLPLERQLTPDSIRKALNWLEKLTRLEKDGLITEPYGIFSRELEFYCKDGHIIVLDCAFQFLGDEQGKVKSILAEGMDITARKRAEERLRNSEEKFRLLAESSASAIMMHQGDHWIYANRAAEEISGYTEEELCGMHFWNIVHPDYRDVVKERGLNRQQGKEMPRAYEFKIITKNGAEKWVSLTGNPIRYEHKPTALISVTDITERKRADEDRIRLNRALRMLSDTNQALIRIADEMTLLNEVCRIIVEIGGYRMAWIGLAENDEAKTVRPVAHAGFESGYVESANLSWADNERGRGPGGIAIRTGQLCITRNIPLDPAFAPWREAAIQHGYKSNIALPLISEGQTFGVLEIYSVEADAFDANEVEILKEMAADLSFGITALRTRVKREQIEVALRESEERYRLIAENTADTIAIFDLNFNPTYVSPSILKLGGYTVQEAMKRTLNQILPPDSLQKASKMFADQMALESSPTADPARTVLMELEQYCKDGSCIWVELAASFLRDNNFKPTGILTVTRDITERKRMEEKLRNDQQELHAIMDATPVAVSWSDQQGNIKYTNRKFQDIFGYTVEDIPDIDVWLLLAYPSPAYREHVLSLINLHIEELAQGKEPNPSELAVVCKDGSVRHVLQTMLFTSDRILVIYYDITEQKRKDQQLHHTLDSLRKAVGTTIQVLVSAVESRDAYTFGHQSRSADLAGAIATEMGLAQDKIEGVRMAGIIHDIGKLSIPAEILSKPTHLTNLEFSLIKEHSRSGYEILKNVESPWPLAEIVYQHHERMDGSGYPRNLKGDEILMESRILSVADVVEAMASHRPYREALGIEAALEEIEKNKGILYDIAVVDACLRLFWEKGYRLS
jgi:PAS domain S-box-containing protein